MIDYSEMFIMIDQLSRDALIDMNNKNVTAAKEKITKLEMAATMLKKYIDWKEEYK